MDNKPGSLLMAIDCVKSDFKKLRNAILHTKTLSNQMGLKPSAVTIVTPKLFNWSLEMDDNLKDALISFGEKNLDDLFSETRGSVTTGVIYQNQPSKKENIQSLLKMAEEKRAAAIAVFSHVRKSHGLSAPGGFISTLISQSTVPVLVINSESTISPLIKTILVATDFSEDCEITMNEAIKLAAKLKANLCVLHVLPSLPQQTLLASSALNVGIVNAESFLSNYEEKIKPKGVGLVKAAQDQGVSLDFVLKRATTPIADQIKEAAVLKKADLIVLTERTGPWEMMLLGSVTRQVLSESNLPVMVMNRNSKTGH